VSDKNTLSLLGVVLLIIGLINIPGTAWARFDWTTVGSAGIVDEADRHLVAFNLATATMRPSAVGTLKLRYNIVAVDGLFGRPCAGGRFRAELGVRFRDNGNEARVIVRLKRYSLVTGDIDTLLMLNSNNYRPRNGFQLQTMVDIDPRLRFDFFDFAYFMDVELRKTTTAGTPALDIIQLASVQC
jgi:hypothetical protein